MENTPRLAAVPRAASATPRHPRKPATAAKTANQLWLRINQARAVVQCIQQQLLDNRDEATAGALAGAAMDQLDLALADISTLEACIH